MIRSMSFKNDNGDLLTLNVGSPDDTGLLIINAKGLGPSETSINTIDGGNRDGGYVSSLRANKRTINMTIAVIKRNTHEESIRRNLYKFFKSKARLELTITTDTVALTIDTYVENAEIHMFTEIENVELSLLCPFPFFRKVGSNVGFIYATNPMLTFPFSNNSLTEKLLIMGEINSYPEALIYNYGDIQTGCVIDIHINSAVTEIVISNNTRNESMRIDVSELESIIGSSLVAGDDIRIDTTVGNKSLVHSRAGIDTNVINSLGYDVSWIGIDVGENSISYSIPEAFGSIDVKISFDELYEGV